MGGKLKDKAPEKQACRKEPAAEFGKFHGKAPRDEMERAIWALVWNELKMAGHNREEIAKFRKIKEGLEQGCLGPEYREYEQYFAEIFRGFEPLMEKSRENCMRRAEKLILGVSGYVQGSPETEHPAYKKLVEGVALELLRVEPEHMFLCGEILSGEFAREVEEWMEKEKRRLGGSYGSEAAERIRAEAMEKMKKSPLRRLRRMLTENNKAIAKMIIEFEKELHPEAEPGDLLFKYWPRRNEYDEHMGKTGHHKAIEANLRQMLLADRAGIWGAPGSVLGERLMEMSCGTGTVIELLLECISEEERKALIIDLNDPSEKMLDRAKTKLKGKVNEFHNCKLREIGAAIGRKELREGMLSSAILSQTLHLVLHMEDAPYEWHEPEVLAEHPLAKENVIGGMLKLLKAGGHFIMMDEWPAKLSSNGPVGLQEAIINELFGETFRPISQSRFERMMGSRYSKWVKGQGIPELAGKFRARIDDKHDMYLYVYRKAGGEKMFVPRGEAVEAIAMAFAKTDEDFRKSYERSVRKEGETLADFFLPFRQGDVFDSRKDGELGEGGKKYDCIILEGQIEGIADTSGTGNWRDGMDRIIAGAIASLKTGGSLLVVENLDALERKIWEDERSKGDFEENIVQWHSGQLMAEGMLRVPLAGDKTDYITGFLFRKIWDAKKSGETK